MKQTKTFVYLHCCSSQQAQTAYKLLHAFHARRGHAQVDRRWHRELLHMQAYKLQSHVTSAASCLPCRLRGAQLKGERCQSRGGGVQDSKIAIFIS
jgi:hypothetical protein